VGRLTLDVSGLKEGPVTSCCEHGNEHSGHMKSGEFLE
jgi:hypothetical protein